jgi:TolA-binding protein
MVKSFFVSFTNGEITLIAASVSAGISAAVAILTTPIKHGPNYEEQIEGLHETIGSLARTQEELRQQQAERDKREEKRYDDQERKAEAARWRPTATIESILETAST